jgi:hypothetical protein
MVTKKAKVSVSKAKSGAQSKVAKKRTLASPKRVLARAEGAQCFWVNDGQILADLGEFSTALKKMAQDTFTYHVDGSRNDFADWIEFVLGDTELATELRNVKKPKQAHTIVVRRLKIYSHS